MKTTWNRINFPMQLLPGKLPTLAPSTLLKDGKYDAEIEGDLKIHGETKKVKEKGTFEVIRWKNYRKIGLHGSPCGL